MTNKHRTQRPRPTRSEILSAASEHTDPVVTERLLQIAGELGAYGTHNLYRSETIMNEMDELRRQASKLMQFGMEGLEPDQGETVTSQLATPEQFYTLDYWADMLPSGGQS